MKPKTQVRMAARCHRQRGIAMTEFVAVAPLILLMILGVTEIGRAMVRYNTLTKAVQDGARHAAAFALLGTTGAVRIDAQLDTEVRNLVAYGNLAGTGQPLLTGLSPGQVTLAAVSQIEIRVDVSYPYVPLFGGGLPDLGWGNGANFAFNMQAAVNMRAL